MLETKCNVVAVAKPQVETELNTARISRSDGSLK